MKKLLNTAVFVICVVVSSAWAIGMISTESKIPFSAIAGMTGLPIVVAVSVGILMFSSLSREPQKVSDGAYMAFSPDMKRLLLQANTMAEVLEEARKKGFTDPLIVQLVRQPFSNAKNEID